VNRRRLAVPVLPATACALIALSSIAFSSCATFNQNDVAAKIGARTLSVKAAQALAATGDTAATGDELREQLTKWIRVTALEADKGIAEPELPLTSNDLDTRLGIAAIAGDRAQSLYVAGVGNSPLICLAAITLATLDEANEVLATVQAGTPFADAARQFSTDTVSRDAGGIVTDQNGNECLDPVTGLNNAVTSALADTPVGQPIVAEFDTFSAVLMLRPYAELLPESKTAIANASVPQAQLTAIVSAADVYVDPRYGRWDPDSASVVILST
jgi:hypothetical protein